MLHLQLYQQVEFCQFLSVKCRVVKTTNNFRTEVAMNLWVCTIGKSTAKRSESPTA